jgi:hypothetical protein
MRVTPNRMPKRPALQLRTLLRDKLTAVAAPHMEAVKRTEVNPIVAAIISNRWPRHQYGGAKQLRRFHFKRALAVSKFSD